MMDIVAQDFEMIQDDESIKITDNRSININNNHIQLGVVRSYDSSKRTAKIQPLVGVMDGNNEYKDMPILNNVPVLHFGTDSYIIHMPIKNGDVVLLLFCDRDISSLDDAEKRNEPSYASSNRMFSLCDCLAIPFCFTQENISISNNNAITIESKNGQTKIELVDNSINILAGNININGNLNLNGTFTNNGINMTTHTHGGVVVGGSQTQGPQ